jgi:RNA polymerase sigma-70 factor, ECF subfamily
VSSTSEVERAFRQESGRAVASLVRVFGDIDIAEEAVQEAFLVALQRWPTAGLPPSPAGWIIMTARNRAIDRLRRESTRDDRQTERCACTHPMTSPRRWGLWPTTNSA